MTEDIVDLTSELADLPDLTVVPLGWMPGWYHVKGRFSWYRCSLGGGNRLPRCSCADHKFRLAGTNRPCRHLRAVEDYLRAQEQPKCCPTCGQELLAERG